MDAVPTHALLVRCRWNAEADLRETAARFCAASGLGLRSRCVARSVDGWAYLYAAAPHPATLDAGVPRQLAERWRALAPQAEEVDVARLELVQEAAGLSRGDAPVNHYVVETDPRAGWEEEIARWYREEHLPGLASVPGCVLARRFVNHDAGPRSHACYALFSEAALGSPPWLAVRGTEWSSRVRPHFTNTRRTMMQLLA